MKIRSRKVLSLFVVVVSICISTSLTNAKSKNLGKLACQGDAGLMPDASLMSTILSKCQPKQNQPEKMIFACLTKCLMKQQKAVDKKSGKLMEEKAKAMVDIFPDEFKVNVTDRFGHCFKEHNDKLKKETNGGCDTWLPFSECFYDYGKSLCNKKTTEEATTSTEKSASK